MVSGLEPANISHHDMNRIATLQRALSKLASVNVAQNWVDWLKSIEDIGDRPIGYKIKQPKGSECCWCGAKTLVGVEHIIPRSVGGPKVERWNLAWSCYACNWNRKDLIGMPMMSSDKATGWLSIEWQRAPKEPTKQELLDYLSGLEPANISR